MAGLMGLVQMLRRAVSRSDAGGDGMTLDKALSYPPVWNAVSKITGHLAYLPLNLHQETAKGNQKKPKHIGWQRMRVRSNGYQTPFVFKRQLQLQALMVGNGYAYIKPDRSELIPMMADRVETMLVRGEKLHFYKPDRDERLTLSEDIQLAMQRSKDAGQAEVIPFSDAEVLHIPGLSYDGVSGKSLISLAARSWNLGIGSEYTERGRQKRGYSGGLMLEAPETSMMKQKDAEEFLDWFRKTHDGEDNAGKTGLLTRGIKANVLNMSASDSQFLENRKFQRQDAALWFLLESILGDDSSVSYNSLEQKNLAYLQNCLGPWLKVWEEECEVKLLTPSELERGYYFKFNDGALLRTDKQTTATIIATLRASQVINANEAREWLDMNPYDGGESYDNPNTTTSKPSGAAAPHGQPDPTAVVQARFEHMLGVEAKQAIAACKASNFVAKIESLYAKWSKTWARAIGEVKADAHCNRAKAELLACADNATTKDALTELVTALVAKWPSKAIDLAKGQPC